MGGFSVAVISCKKLSFTYPKNEYPALENVSFSIEEGEFCLVMGKSAAGKSTLLKLLKKEIAPFGKISGELVINKTVGFVSQNVDESIVCDKVRSELSFGLSNMGMTRDEIELLVAETASYFHIENKLDSDISALSGGEKQMVNLAAVMIMKPDILVLDEPVSQLDPVSAERFIFMIKQLHRDFSTTIVISEHTSENLFDYADSVMLIDNARLLYKASGKDMINYLKENNHDMLRAVPVRLRLYSDAQTISECRKIARTKNIKSIHYPKENCKSAIDVKNIYFAYSKGYDVLSELSLKVFENKINAVLGPNSSGKSTLLKTIAGVQKAYRGKIKKNGTVSMLCQNVFDLFIQEKCSEETEFGEVTDFLAINDIKDKHPYDLSGGQAQRLALAKVLNRGADIILLDEPTKGLDPVLKNKLAEILGQLCRQGKTILIVSHDIEFIGEYADYVSFLSDGRIVSTVQKGKFFSSLNFYTTAISKITKGIAENIVSLEDFKNSGGME